MRPVHTWYCWIWAKLDVAFSIEKRIWRRIINWKGCANNTSTMHSTLDLMGSQSSPRPLTFRWFNQTWASLVRTIQDRLPVPLHETTLAGSAYMHYLCATALQGNLTSCCIRRTESCIRKSFSSGEEEARGEKLWVRDFCTWGIVELQPPSLL